MNKPYDIALRILIHHLEVGVKNKIARRPGATRYKIANYSNLVDCLVFTAGMQYLQALPNDCHDQVRVEGWRGRGIQDVHASPMGAFRMSISDATHHH